MNKIRLDEVVSLQNGYAFKSKDFLESGIPVVKIKNVKPDGLTLHKLDFIAKEMITDKLKKYIIPDDSILVTLSGNRYGGNPETWVGKACYYNTRNPMLLNQRVASLTSKDSEVLNTRWLAYLLGSWKYQEKFVLMSNSSGGQANISPSDVLSLEINLPPLQEQKAIAEVLSSLDDKIELLQKQNETLEALAQTLFRQWFIEEADDSWEEACLSDEFNLTMGQSPPGTSYNESALGIPMYQGNADFSFRFPVKRVFTSEPKRLANKYDTLISVRAPVGEQNMAFEKCCIGRGVAAISHPKGYFSYTYYKINSIMKQISAFNDTGTVFGSISKKDLERISISIPPAGLIEKFEEVGGNLEIKVHHNEESLNNLKMLRDTLLPKLMSGQVRVKQD